MTLVCGLIAVQHTPLIKFRVNHFSLNIRPARRITCTSLTGSKIHPAAFWSMCIEVFRELPCPEPGEPYEQIHPAS